MLLPPNIISNLSTSKDESLIDRKQ